MSDFTFLHAADLHLDTPFDGLGAVRPEVADSLRDASLEAFDRLIDLALLRRVAFVLLAGDLYDGAVRGLRAQLRFHGGLERLAAAGIRTFVVHGNHDPLEEGWNALPSLPAGAYVFPAGEPQAVEVEWDGEVIATVHGVSYGRREERENLARRFAPGSRGLQIGLLHAHVEGQAGHDPYAPCRLADLKGSGFDYWALGHIHQRQTLSRGDCTVVYPGNLQGRSHKPSECGAKGAVLVEVAGGAVAGVEFAELAPVRFELLCLDIGPFSELAALQRALVDQMRPLLRSPGLRGVVARVELVGRGPLHQALQREEAALVEALEDATCGTEPWVAWERLSLRTAPAVDAAAMRERDDFAGELLREIDRLAGDEAALTSLLGEIDGEIAEGDLNRLLQPPDTEEAARLLRAAEAFALDRFGDEA